MSNHVILLSKDNDLVFHLRKQLRNGHEMNCSNTLEDLANQLATTSAQTVLVHLTAESLGEQTPSSFVADLKAHTDKASIVALFDQDCPARLRSQLERTANHCFDMPAHWDELRAVLGADLDPEEELAGLWVGLPHKELHGHSRSLVTFTPEMFEMMDEIKVAAKHDVTVLLVGETGSGKTHLARLVHELSNRREERLCTVACGALPPDLIESELFGYVKGAFTGAGNDKEGKFAAAGRGTLLLDEIDVLSLDQQAKLLRVIETGEYEPVGSNDTVTSQARLVVASNYNLEDLVQAGNFRIDLYYRLNVLKFCLLPLRERPWDIEYLARKFALEHSRTHDIPLTEIDSSLLDALRHYPWPGNIREMENVIRRAVLYSQHGVLTLRDLPSNFHSVNGDKTYANAGFPQVTPLVASRVSLNELEPPTGSEFVSARAVAGQNVAVAGVPGTAASGKPSSVDHKDVEFSQSKTLEARVDLIECRIIEDSLRRNNHRRKETSAELGISRVTLYNKMKKFGLMG